MKNEQYDALVSEGNHLLKIDEYKKAIKLYKKALKIHPKDPAIWNNKGLCLAKLGKHHEAIDCYNASIGIDPVYAKAWGNKGISLDVLNKSEEALGSFDKAVSLDPKFLIAWLQKGICLAHLGRHEEAIKCYNQMLHIDPGHVSAWHNKALSADALSRNLEAVSSYRRFLINFVNSGMMGREIVQQVKQRINDLENNRSGEKVSIAQTELFNLNSQTFMMNILYIYSNVRDLDELINQMTDLQSFGKPADINKHYGFMSPEIREIYKLFGMACDELGQENLPEAVQGFKRALEIAPDFIAARHNLAAAYIGLNRDYDALQELETALTYSQEDADIYHKLGQLYLDHDLNKSVINNQKALRLKPNYVDAFLGLGYCYIKMNLFDEAEKALLRGLELIDNNLIEGTLSPDLNTEKYEFYTSLIAVLAQKDNLTGAIQCIQKGLENFPNDERFVEMLKKMQDQSIRQTGLFEETKKPIQSGSSSYEPNISSEPDASIAADLDNNTLSESELNSSKNIDNSGLENAGQTLSLETDPKEVDNWYEKGKNLYVSEKYQEAIDCLSNGLAISPENADAWFLKAQSEEWLGLKLEAIRSYDKVLLFAHETLFILFANRRIKELEGNRYYSVKAQENVISSNSKQTKDKTGLPLVAYYEQGDVIGKRYEVNRVLGNGAFGVVYLVYAPQSGEVYAMKTFRDEYLADAQIKYLFRKEASIWVELERHPYLVRAYWVDEISGRLFIAMEYIAPKEQGINTLDDYLKRRPPDLPQSLRWAIQICHGMEYAYSKGIRAHRDIKPANIMISQDGIIKITDFGLANVLSASMTSPSIQLNTRKDGVSISGQTQEGGGFGTLTHMPPEQFSSATICDERSDIYAVGVVLFQMASGGQLPFMAPKPKYDSEEEWLLFGVEMKRLQSQAPVPKLDSPLFSIIQRCMEKSPEKRYQTFKELRNDLEPLLQQQTGEIIIPPLPKELEAWEWNNKGFSLNNLGRQEEAIRCLDKALELDPHSEIAWNNKIVSLRDLGRNEEAIFCCDQVLEFEPRNASALCNKGTCLGKLGHQEDAISCFDQALNIDLRDTAAWYNKSVSLNFISHYEEALHCCDQALELDPSNATVWVNKGVSLASLGRSEEAIRCYDHALELDPRDAITWKNKGGSLESLGRHEEAIHCFDQALELDPRNATIYYNKGLSLFSLGRHEEAIRYFDETLKLNPRFSPAWNNKGASLASLSCHEEAIRCFDQALKLDPSNLGSLYNRALIEDQLGRRKEAVRSYRQFLTMEPQDSQQIELARQRLQELEGG